MPSLTKVNGSSSRQSDNHLESNRLSHIISTSTRDNNFIAKSNKNIFHLKKDTVLHSQSKLVGPRITKLKSHPINNLTFIASQNMRVPKLNLIKRQNHKPVNTI